MSQGEEQEVVQAKNSRDKKRRSSKREERIELPTHMRNKFLQDTSHLPVRVFRHLESYIKPTVSRALSPPKRAPGKRPLRTRVDSPHPPNTANMDLGPDLYTEAEILEAQKEPDPQRESSSAAASRAQSKKQLSSSASSSSRYSHELALSPDSEAEQSDKIQFRSNYKSHPTTKVCKMHEFTFSSQYTRPATELLQEILEVRYPPGGEDEGGDDEERPLLGARRSQGQERFGGCWWQKWTRALVRG